MGICGDLGSDESLTEFFVKVGVDELSVPPSPGTALAGKNKKYRLRKEFLQNENV